MISMNANFTDVHQYRTLRMAILAWQTGRSIQNHHRHAE